jgi:predicted RNA methylase
MSATERIPTGWTAHNVRLPDGRYTVGADVPLDPRLAWMLETIRLHASKPFDELRVLDLACLEGLFAIECALHGAQAVGIEGRSENLDRAQYAADQLGLANISLVQDDVQNLSEERYGCFDVVLAFGIVYHLDAPDVFRFLDQVASVCDGVALIDTHTSLTGRVETSHGGHVYRGHWYSEGARTHPWASLDNQRSFWLTLPSLVNHLERAGFSWISQQRVPRNLVADRVWLTCAKRVTADVRTVPGCDVRQLPLDEPNPPVDLASIRQLGAALASKPGRLMHRRWRRRLSETFRRRI